MVLKKVIHLLKGPRPPAPIPNGSAQCPPSSQISINGVPVQIKSEPTVSCDTPAIISRAHTTGPLLNHASFTEHASRAEPSLSRPMSTTSAPMVSSYHPTTVTSHCQARIFNHPRDGGDCQLYITKQTSVTGTSVENFGDRGGRRRRGSRQIQARWLCSTCEPKFRHPQQRYFPMDHCLRLNTKKGLKTRKLFGKDCKIFRADGHQLAVFPTHGDAKFVSSKTQWPLLGREGVIHVFYNTKNKSMALGTRPVRPGRGSTLCIECLSHNINKSCTNSLCSGCCCKLGFAARCKSHKYLLKRKRSEDQDGSSELSCSSTDTLSSTSSLHMMQPTMAISLPDPPPPFLKPPPGALMGPRGAARVHQSRSFCPPVPDDCLSGVSVPMQLPPLPFPVIPMVDDQSRHLWGGTAPMLDDEIDMLTAMMTDLNSPLGPQRAPLKQCARSSMSSPPILRADRKVFAADRKVFAADRKVFAKEEVAMVTDNRNAPQCQSLSVSSPDDAIWLDVMSKNLSFGALTPSARSRASAYSLDSAPLRSPVTSALDMRRRKRVMSTGGAWSSPGRAEPYYGQTSSYGSSSNFMHIPAPSLSPLFHSPRANYIPTTLPTSVIPVEASEFGAMG
eukprot:197793_1